ncbi:unnamed protein product [Caenorhabditis sp. 36 PRJEB53466]|nr:unnamed protein product [Caenorhabditis sp. 36 PRJEB53466]
MVESKVHPAIKPGTQAVLELKNGLKFHGIVLSFDLLQNILVLDTKEVTASKPIIRVFNLNHVISCNPENLKSPVHFEDYAAKKNEQFTINNDKTKTRERLHKTMSEVAPTLMSSLVSLRGQQAFLQLKRTIADTRWSGEDIRVLGLVLVHSPYGAEDVRKDANATGFDETRATTAIAQVQKILSKPLTEYKSRAPLDFTIGATVVN